MSKDTPSLSPVSVVVATVATAAGFAVALHVKSRRCQKCSGYIPPFSPRFRCVCCDDQLCESCARDQADIECLGETVTGGTYCSPKCRDDLVCQMKADIRDIKEQVRLQKLASAVKLYFHPKPGKKPQLNLTIETSPDLEFESWDEAEWELRWIAAKHGCREVFGVARHPHPRRDGNRRYKVWSMGGVI